MSHVVIYDSKTREKLITFTNNNDANFPFNEVFKWATHDGKIKHLISPNEMSVCLMNYKLPSTLVIPSVIDSAYHLSSIPLNNTLAARFEAFVSFLYSLSHEGRGIVIKSIGMFPYCIIS